MAINPKIELRNFLVNLCQEVSVYMRSQLEQVRNEDIEEKELNSLVSYVDKEAEKMIVKALKEITPDAGFLTEEDTKNEIDKPQVWIIDPIDGTTNYLRKIPHFSTSIALMENGVVTLGIVYETMQDVAYTAIKGQGAWRNDQPLNVSKVDKLSEAIVVTGFPYKRDKNMEANFELLKFCVMNCRGIRRLGSAALDLAYVADGKIDIYYESSLNIWDIAAGILLVQEAKGAMTDLEGNNNFLDSGNVIACSPALHKPMLDAIAQAYHKV